MKRLLVLGLVIFPASLVGQVEHAPTVAQCQADQKLWSAESTQAREGTGFDLSIRAYSLNELAARMKEMTACVSIDPSHGKYESTAMVICSQVERRLVRFIQETGQADDYDAWEKKQAGKVAP